MTALLSIRTSEVDNKDSSLLTRGSLAIGCLLSVYFPPSSGSLALQQQFSKDLLRNQHLDDRPRIPGTRAQKRLFHSLLLAQQVSRSLLKAPANTSQRPTKLLTEMRQQINEDGLKMAKKDWKRKKNGRAWESAEKEWQIRCGKIQGQVDGNRDGWALLYRVEQWSVDPSFCPPSSTKRSAAAVNSLLFGFGLIQVSCRSTSSYFCAWRPEMVLYSDIDA